MSGEVSQLGHRGVDNASVSLRSLSNLGIQKDKNTSNERIKEVTRNCLLPEKALGLIIVINCPDIVLYDTNDYRRTDDDV